MEDSKTVSMSQIGYGRVNSNVLAFYLSGIIPINKDKSIFNLPYDDCLAPIGSGITLIERSVMECVYVGCNVIWIVCNEKAGGQIKELLGDYVMGYNNKYIPIHYLSVDFCRNAQKKTLTHSILYGMLISYWIARKLSVWTIPIKYYVAFPMSVYPVDRFKELRRFARNEKRDFYLSANDQTFKTNNTEVGFTVSFNSFIEFRNRWRDVFYDRRMNKAKDLIRLEEVFDWQKVRVIEMLETNQVEVANFVKVDSWDKYINYLNTVEDKHRITKDNTVFAGEGRSFRKVSEWWNGNREQPTTGGKNVR